MNVAAAPVLFLLLLLWWVPALVKSQSSDGAAMKAIYESFKPDPPAIWTSGSDYCSWGGVTCASGGKVTEIIIKTQNLRGSLSPELQTLSSLKRLEVQENQLTGAFPNLKGIASLDRIYAHTNQFTSFPADDDFFVGLTSLSEFSISRNPTLKPWQIPKTVTAASKLSYFEASNASLIGNIPDYFNITYMPSLTDLELGSNNLQGQLPAFFSVSGIQKLRLEGNNLTGNLDVLGTMTDLNEVHLNMNHFTGPLPDLSNLTSLQVFNVRDNQLTGIVPPSLVNLDPKVVTLSNNLFQGPMPDFSGSSGQVDIGIGNSFCADKVGQDCDPRVKILLNIAKDLDYPNKLAEDWQGNDPCQGKGGSWPQMTCSGGDITGINLGRMSLAGTISSNFSLITSLVNLKLNDNNLTGTIPKELADLPNLKTLDLSNNALYGQVPSFRSNVVVKVEGNPNIGKGHPSVPVPGAPTGPDSNKKSKTGVIVGVVVGCAVGLVFVGLLVFCLMKRKKKHDVKEQSPSSLVIHPRHSGDQNAVKITIVNRFNGSGSGSGSGSESHNSPASHRPNDIHVEAGNMIISIQVLRNVTNNFSEDKILGKGGFGTVYEGELHDGTKIAVKRMESGVVAEKGLNEFKSEIAVLRKVRHRHLVGLLGYCLDGNEKLLVYEHMPQGNLTRHLFHWKEEGLEPLEWTKRLTIALDVARGVEYLHALANEIFIHRDLKPSNILLGDDMRAKVADFGLVRLAPAGKNSFETRLAGTFGYLAPEYAATGRMTLKVDVYSFGVILMELITGRKAIDESEPEESCHLVTWFRRKLITREAFPDVVDPTIDVNEETLSSIIRVAELAGHCSAREPQQRPDMGHAVNVLSSLVEQWKPSKQQDYDEMDAIDFNMPLKEAVKMWQASEGKSNMDESSSSSTYPKSRDSTQSSIPDRASGFLTSFTSSDGR